MEAAVVGAVNWPTREAWTMGTFPNTTLADVTAYKNSRYKPSLSSRDAA